ncbi:MULTISPECIES: HAD family hydrolase [unclassified Coleofasciculus]|uniref:HAD family hydrolase n=1 Tax=unclassified Coleofasciculus TaxID=2692782 RepID=UPI001882D653|nr:MULTISPECIES: HAD family hydrolase [unclassified Coleofasciculus]MBE9127363.1 HAD family hydrolase [Coleofasciculus sp. LEGE 07081]MBE9150653.1 HAD family hydrolase [Coleofasciculus sp. LEGE 07092]
MIGVAASNPQPPLYYRSQSTSPCSEQLTVFCDFDGPIIDVSNRYYTTYKLALADTQAAYQDRGIILPLHSLSKQQFWHMKQDRVPDVEIAMRSGLQGEQIDFFLGRVLDIVNQPALLGQDKLQPGASWALALLHSQGVRLVLVTLRCQLQATQILRNYGLTCLFSGIYGTSNHQAAYRNNVEVKQQLLEQAITEQSTRPGRPCSAWMVGDTEADLLAAQALSIPAIALTCGIRSNRYLKQFHPNFIYSNLLATAHYLLKTNKVVSHY